MKIPLNLSALIFLVIATTLEVNGDALVRIAIYHQSGIARAALMLAGAALLFGYGFCLNMAPLEFGQVAGLYIAVLFVVWQATNFLTFRTLPTLPILVGGTLIIAGGLLITFWKGWELKEGRRQKAEGGGQKAEGRRRKAEEKSACCKNLCHPERSEERAQSKDLASDANAPSCVHAPRECGPCSAQMHRLSALSCRLLQHSNGMACEVLRLRSRTRSAQDDRSFCIAYSSFRRSAFRLPPSAFCLLPSAFILHPSSFILHPFRNAPRHLHGRFFPDQRLRPETPTGKRLLIDAPEGSADWLRANDWKLDALLLTHAHIDHIHDAAAIVRAHGCPIYYHPDGIPLLQDKNAYRRYGLSIDFEPVEGGELIGETKRAEFAGQAFEILFVPGHCPGSVCFYDAERGELFAGDVLFAGSIGRTDLPGGDHELLLRGIREKVLPLPGEVVVFPGHGPATTVGEERESNPFLT